jgi:hypothetical protein
MGQKSAVIAALVTLTGATSASAGPAPALGGWLNSPSSATAADLGQILDAPAFIDGRGPVRATSRQRSSARPGGAVDTVRVTVVEAPVVSAAAPGAPYAAAGYDVSYTRNWPGAWRFNAGRYGVDVSPHAGLGVSTFGRSAEAGAEFSLDAGDRPGRRSLKDLGPAKDFGGAGRWYLFAAVGSKAVGLNMARGGDGDWQRAGWSQEAASALIGDGQLGLGYRKGAMQAAFGYVHREIKVQNSPRNADAGVDDSMAAFTFSIKSRK